LSGARKRKISRKQTEKARKQDERSHLVVFSVIFAIFLISEVKSPGRRVAARHDQRHNVRTHAWSAITVGRIEDTG
jgi:hypothetical protein